MLNLKKPLSLLLSLMLAIPCTTAFSSNAEEELITLDPSYITDELSLTEKNSKAVDLISIAKAQGGDTNHFPFPNYIPESVSEEMLKKLADLGQSSGILGGMCYGISVLEILTHNGIISPSDIQEGAETLMDIEYNDEVNDIIFYYSVMQNFSPQSPVMKEYYCSHDDKDVCNDLIKYGKRAMETGEYFLINADILALDKNSTGGHSIVGIGIADGNWKFNGKSYDKCILTLDSNCVDPNDNSVSVGYKEKAFIYLNSQTNEYYFPAYECGSMDERIGITYIGNDLEMLNYKGFIKPSEDHNHDYDKIKQIQIGNYRECEYDIKIENNGKAENYHGYPYTGENGMTKKFRKLLTGKHMFEYYRNADSLTVEVPDGEDSHNGGFEVLLAYPNMFTSWAAASFDFAKFHDRTPDKCTLKVEQEKAGIINKKDLPNTYSIFLSFLKKPYMPYFCITSDLHVNSAGEYFISVKDDGFLVETNHMTEMLMDISRGDRALTDPECTFTTTLTTNNNVMIKYDPEKDYIYFAIGENFDKVVQKGDANCDGMINAADASVVLKGYASEQVGNWNYANPLISDMDGDGCVNAIDASMILAMYAKEQTS